MTKKHVHPLDRIHIDSSQTMGTLAQNALLKFAATALLQDYRMVSVKGVVGLHGWTIADGPLLFGIAANDLLAAEIEETLETAILRSGDAIASEHKMRQVQVLGGLGNTRETIWIDERIRLKTFVEDLGFAFWVYNPSQALTTGSFLSISLQCFGRWL